MKYYFTLQFKMLNRKITEFGLPPILGYLLGCCAFIGLSWYLFMKIELANYIYSFLGLSFLSLLTDIKRNDFLKSCFSDNQYYQVRLIENLLLVLPFVAFLILKNNWSIALGMLIISGLSTFLRTNNSLQFSIPTPFYKNPFEFTVGLRKTFFIFIGAYVLTYIAISVDNFNLGAFALGVTCFTTFSFYAEPEEDFFVWTFSRTPASFLLQKIKIALLSLTLLCLPILVSLGIAFPQFWRVLLIFQSLGYLYLVAVLLAKYSAFPRKISVPQGFLLAFGVWLPPLLVFIIPFFYKKSIQQLKQIL
ncbi:MAG: ABC transporter permease [Saprospiraceae bacterium]